MQENPPLSITTCAKWCYTLWTWRKERLRNCRRGSGVICCWSCLVRSWSLQNEKSLRMEKILKRSSIAWTSEESYNVSRRFERWGAHVAILDGVSLTITDAPRSFTWQSLRTESWKSGVSRRPFNALSLSWCSWADEDLNHKCGSSVFNCRLYN